MRVADRDLGRALRFARGRAAEAAVGLVVERGVEPHRFLLAAVVLEVHAVAQHVVDRELFRARVEAGAAVWVAIRAGDAGVVALEDGEVVLVERAAGCVQVLVDVRGLRERHDEAADVGVRQHPPERGLGVRRGVGAERGQVLMARALQRLHRDDAHVLLGGLVDDAVEVGPDAVMIGEHHDVEALGRDRGARDALEVGGVGRDAEEADLALLLQAVERLVGVRIEQALDLVAGVDVDQVDVVGLQAAQAALDRLHVRRDRAAGGEVPVRRTELGRDEHTVAVALHGAAHGLFRAGAGIVGRGVEVRDAALDRVARDRFAVLALDGTGAERHVGDGRTRSAEPAIGADAGALPRRQRVRRRFLDHGLEDLADLWLPADVASAPRRARRR